ncbi:hypothetical protein SAMN04488564_102131 [Lentzea waywayandensis]|uniref:Uncharacterized protein n=1 Tax=Lentzea waywayandensis TaxID=84724 RepID=A0A1I6DB08_9PSEU|nr:DUF6084 family protein [Lentzea waywayandensis]SFR02541.1 hypothetical protein SAMN04488564_102131 [Lentzea waywayandensis]
MDMLHFECEGAWPTRYAAVPGLTLRLRVVERSGAPVEAVALRCQIRIEPQRRTYSAGEAQRLSDLFGDTGRWTKTLKPVSFATLSTMVPGFTGSTFVDLDVPCTYDLEVASTKYFNALDNGQIPLLLLFSGTVFGSQNGNLRVWQVPWSNEASFALPVSVWRETVDLHFPGSAWLRVRRDTMDALQRFRSEHAFATWDDAMTAMLAATDG